MTPVTTPGLRQINSVSYADVAGLQLGLPRLPGEETPVYLERLHLAANALRNHSYQGAMNELSSRLGLQLSPGITVANEVSTIANVWVDAAGLHLTGPDLDSHWQQWDYALRTIAGDNLWQWRTLADLTADINTTPNFSATLVANDAPALQLVQQNNVELIVGEVLRGPRGWLEHSGLLADSVHFSNPVPAYTLTVDGQYSFVAEPATGTTVTYRYRTLPYSLIVSEIAITGLLDAGLASTLTSPTGLVYQVREAIQDFMRQDRSYWGK